MNKEMTNEQIQSRAIELFKEHGSNSRRAFSYLFQEVIASGRVFWDNRNGKEVLLNLHNEVEKLAWPLYPTPDFLKKDKEVLESIIGKTITIIFTNSFGFICRLVCKLEAVAVRNYAQYDNIFFVQYRQKRKQKSSTFCIGGEVREIAIYEGEIDLNTNPLAKVVKNNKEVTIISEGFCFDDRRFPLTVAKIDKTPIFIRK